MTFIPFEAKATESYLYASASQPATTPTSNDELLHPTNILIAVDTDWWPGGYRGNVFLLNVKVSLQAKQLIITAPVATAIPRPPTNNFRYLQIKVKNKTYQISAGESIVVDIEQYGAQGSFEMRAVSLLSQGDWATTWLVVQAEPFVIPTPAGYPIKSTGPPESQIDLLSIPGGWVTFEKTLWFNNERETVQINGIDFDSGNIYDGVTIPAKSGFYAPDYLTVNTHDAYLQASAGTGPALRFTYDNSIPESTFFTQIAAPDELKIQPNVSVQTVTSGQWHQRILVKQANMPSGYINNASTSGGAKTLMYDGTIRLLVSKTVGGFDLYKASGTGVTLMFENVWDETYHGAQIAWVLDGTLVSYAWKINYVAAHDDVPAHITYSLYFKRSLNDGAQWEIRQTVAEDIEFISGLPVLTQNPATGVLKIANMFSNDMGLTWN